jgi:hypothetical protein
MDLSSRNLRTYEAKRTEDHLYVFFLLFYLLLIFLSFFLSFFFIIPFFPYFSFLLIIFFFHFSFFSFALQNFLQHNTYIAFVRDDVIVNNKKWCRRKADLWAELGDEYHSAGKKLLKGIGKGRLRSAVRHRSAEGLFALLKGEFSRMRGDMARCKERTS